jgi:hypothetical protein
LADSSIFREFPSTPNCLFRHEEFLAFSFSFSFSSFFFFLFSFSFLCLRCLMDHIWSSDDEQALALKPLLDTLQLVIDLNDGTSLTLLDDLAAAKQDLAFAKEQYFRHLLLHSHMQQLFIDNLHRSNPSSTTIPRINAHHQQVSSTCDVASQLVALEEALQYIEHGVSQQTAASASASASASAASTTNNQATTATSTNVQPSPTLLGLGRDTVITATIGTCSPAMIQQVSSLSLLSLSLSVYE